MKTYILQLLKVIGILVFLSSCGRFSNITIYFPSDFVKKNEVIINKNINLAEHIVASKYSKIQIKKGNVEISINGKIINVRTEEGGMLNLKKEEFVILPVHYSNSDKNTDFQFNMSLLIDSTVYYNDVTFLGKKFGIDHHIKNAVRSYSHKDSKRLATGLITKGDLFAEKSWDYNIDEEIPEMINVNVDRNSGGNTRETKSVLMTANSFKKMTKISSKWKSKDLRKKSQENGNSIK